MSPNWGGGLQGAGGGALAGSAIAPGIGTAIGAGVGLLGGLFGGSGEDEATKRYREQLAALGSQGMTAGQAGFSDLRGRQVSQLDALRAAQMGQGPSLAQEQMRDAMARAAASQQALAGSAIGRGVGPGGAYRNAASTTGAMQQQGARDTGMMRAAEQMAAMNQYTGALQGARGMDESMNQFNVGQSNDMLRAQRQMQLQALMNAGGMNPKTGPSMGEQILAGGSTMYGAMGGGGGSGGGQGTEQAAMLARQQQMAALQGQLGGGAVQGAGAAVGRGVQGYDPMQQFAQGASGGLFSQGYNPYQQGWGRPF